MNQEKEEMRSEDEGQKGVEDSGETDELYKIGVFGGEVEKT
jgi:hypothetical protein